MTLTMILLVQLFAVASALISPRHINHVYRRSIRPTPIILYSTSKSNDDDDDMKKNTEGSQPDEILGNMSDADFNHKKVALENMLKSSNTGESDATPNINVLTTSRKQKLEREIELLRMLDPDHPENNRDYSDLQNQELVVSELWSLWYGERGPMNERRLRAIEETIVDPDMWADAEKQYLSLIDEHCRIGTSEDDLDLSRWVEPANRLATLLFVMGRFGESKKWCDRILSVKPWHIGALSGVVMVCMKMGDKEGVLKYSLIGLPNSTPQMRSARKDWVRKNVELAEKNLLLLEELNRKAYGEPDESGAKIAGYEESSNEPPAAEADENGTVDDSAWQ